MVQHGAPPGGVEDISGEANKYSLRALRDQDANDTIPGLPLAGHRIPYRDCNLHEGGSWACIHHKFFFALTLSPRNFQTPWSTASRDFTFFDQYDVKRTAEEAGLRTYTCADDSCTRRWRQRHAVQPRQHWVRGDTSPPLYAMCASVVCTGIRRLDDHAVSTSEPDPRVGHADDRGCPWNPLARAARQAAPKPCTVRTL